MLPRHRTNVLLALTIACIALPGCSGGTANESPDAQAMDATGGPDDDAGATLDGATSGDASGRDGSEAAAPDAASDAAADVESPDAALCNTCSGGSVCVSDQVLGGAVIRPDDAGLCPAGRIPSDAGALVVCVQEAVYHCETLPGACFPTGGAAPSPCFCDPSICPDGFNCSLPGAPAHVQCEELVP